MMKVNAGEVSVLTSVIIPAYNEEKVIEKTLSKLTTALKSKFEIIVVINGCCDNTLKNVDEFSKKDNRVKYLEFKDALGKGGAVLEGFKVSGGRYMGFIDADGAFEIGGIMDMMEVLYKGGADCVIASKWKGIDSSQIPQRFTRKLMRMGLNILARRILGLKFDDTQGGAKFMSREVFDAIDKNFICKGFDFDIELLYKIQNKKFRIWEEYIPTTCPEKSSIGLMDILSILFNIFRLRLLTVK